MLEVDSNTLAELLNKSSRGRFGLDKTLEIQDKVRNSFGKLCRQVPLLSSFASSLKRLNPLRTALPSLVKRLATFWQF